MATTMKAARAWVPATVTTLLTIVLLFGCGLAREILDDRNISVLQDRTNVLSAFFYGPMAPLGGPGIVGDLPFGDSMARLGGGVVPVVILVFLFTWISARAARSGSSLTVLLGAWLGTILGVGLGSLASYEIFRRQNDIPDEPYGLLQKLNQVEVGLYWGAVAGFVLGLVALLTWLIVRPRADQAAPDPDTEPDPEPTPWPPPAQEPPDLSSYPPPGKHQMPAGVPEPTEETGRPPEPPAGPRRTI